jgi:histidinol-phosphate phosphatase family protein
LETVKGRRQAVFLDRDGTINEIVFFPDIGLLDSPLVPEQFKLLEHVPEAIRTLNQLGLLVVVVSNQPAIQKGKLTRSNFEKIRRKMLRDLEREKAYVDADYYCFHTSLDNCDCRKPKPGMLIQAARDLDIDLSKSYMVGDSLVDVKAGHSVGCETFLIGNVKCDLCKLMEKEGCKPDIIVTDLSDAARIIEKEVKKRKSS